MPERLGTSRRAVADGSRKNPLIGSLSSTPVSLRASMLATLESFSRSGRPHSSMLAPSAKRLATATSASPAFTLASIATSNCGSCW